MEKGMETKQITPAMKAMLDAPLPTEAVRPHPSKSYLSTINSIYVTERLNDVFGVGSWHVRSEIVEAAAKMVVVKTTFEIPAYGIFFECYGGNDNADRGDAYKGAVTDAITKIGSWLGIGAHVWKNDPTGQKTQAATKASQPKTPTAPKPDIGKRRERIMHYLKNLDDVTFNSYCDYFHIEDVNLMTDDQVNAVANYLNAQNKKQ